MFFSHFAKWMSKMLGHPLAFAVAVVIIIGWALVGPLFHFSDTWQLVVNTGTTIITFLMVFLIQNSQNRDSEAMQLKLDELIRAIRSADNSILNTENMPEKDLQHLQEQYSDLSHMKQNSLQSVKTDKKQK